MAHSGAFIQFEALAYELQGKYLLQRGCDTAALHLLEKAEEGYHHTRCGVLLVLIDHTWWCHIERLHTTYATY